MSSKQQLDALELVRTLRALLVQGNRWGEMLRVLQQHGAVSDLPDNVHEELVLVRKEVLDRMSIARTCRCVCGSFWRTLVIGQCSASCMPVCSRLASP